MNPWLIIGGVATSIVREGEFMSSDGARIGDVIVRTKPLNTDCGERSPVANGEWEEGGYALAKVCQW